MNHPIPITLTETDRASLHTFIHAGKANARTFTRARALLKADEGWSDAQIAEAADHLGGRHLGGDSASSVAQNLGIGHTSLLYRWKAEILGQEGRAASALEIRVRQLEEQLRRTERERDILKKALAIFSQGT